MKIHGFYGYGFYHEQKKLTHESVIITNSCKADVEIDGDSKNIITITDKGLLAKLGLEVVPSNGQNLLRLTDVAHGNAEIASVEYPLIKSIDGGSYDSESKEIKLNISLIGGETDEIAIDVEDLVSLYKQGQGISIGDDNKISIKLDENNNDALTLTDDGLGIDLSGYATVCDLDRAVAGKQDKLTAGDGISITNNVISVTASTPAPKLYEIVQSLDDVTDPRPNIIYLVPEQQPNSADTPSAMSPSESAGIGVPVTPDTGGTVATADTASTAVTADTASTADSTTQSSGVNRFVEYIWVNNEWEQLGYLPGEIDPSNYYTKSEINAYSGAVAASLDLMNTNIESAFTMIDEEAEARLTNDNEIIERLNVLTPHIEKTPSGYTYTPPQSQYDGGVFDEVWWLVHNAPTGSGVTHIESSDSSVTITYDSETNTYDLKVDVDTDSLWDKGAGQGSILTNDTLSAKNKNEVAIGSYNLSLQSGDTFIDSANTSGGTIATATSNTVFSVGIGDDPQHRKNALEVRDDGTVWMWVENQFMNVTDLLGQIAHESDEYEP